MILKIIIIIVFLFLSALFSASETAFTSLSKVQLETLSRKSSTGKLLKKMSERPDIFMATVLICNNLVNLSLSAFITSLTIQLGGSDILGFVTGALTLVLLIFGEVTPKNIALTWNEQISVLTVPLIKFFSIIFYPFIIIINFCSRLITALLGKKQESKITTEMIYSVINNASINGAIKDYERRMMKGIINLRESTLKNIITHRTDVFSLNEEMEAADALSELSKVNYTRFPIYKNNPEHITGIVKSLTVLIETIKLGNIHTKLKDIKDDPLYIRESKTLDALFLQMRKERNHFAVVYDEYGGLSGIITFEDIVEEILGEVYEKEDIIPETEKIEKVKDKEFIFAGEAPLINISEKARVHFPFDDSTRTIGGFLIKAMERIPSAGETFTDANGTFIIEEASDRQILQVRFIKRSHHH